MRKRRRILTSLEAAYREAFRRAEENGDAEEMARLDFQYQRDQIRMEVLLDIRDLLATAPASTAEAKEEGQGSLLDKAEALRRLTRLR